MQILSSIILVGYKIKAHHNQLSVKHRNNLITSEHYFVTSCHNNLMGTHLSNKNIIQNQKNVEASYSEFDFMKRYEYTESYSEYT